MSTPKEKNKNLLIILAAVAIVAVVVIALTSGDNTSSQLVNEEIPAEQAIENATTPSADTAAPADAAATTGEETPVANTADSVKEGLEDAGNAIDNTVQDVSNAVGADTTSNSVTPSVEENTPAGEAPAVPSTTPAAEAPKQQ